MRLTDFYVDKLESATKIAASVTLMNRQDVIDTDGTNFPRKLLLTDRQVASLCKAFKNS